MIAGDVERVAILEEEERNFEDALAREERGEDLVIADYKWFKNTV